MCAWGRQERKEAQFCSLLERVPVWGWHAHLLWSLGMPPLAAAAVLQCVNTAQLHEQGHERRTLMTNPLTDLFPPAGIPQASSG